MNPVLQEIYNEALLPVQNEEISFDVGLDRAIVPLQEFMLGQTREKDMLLFMDMAEQPPVEEMADIPLSVLVPAFITSELKTAFTIGFLIYIPFWLLFLPKDFSEISDFDLVLQLVFQGVVPNLIGLLLVTTAVKTIGSASTSAFLAGVPATASILSLFILGEYLGMFGWLGIIFITPGILLLALMENRKKTS